MVKQKACRRCKKIFSGSKCPNCGSEEVSESFKGKIVVFNPESEIAKKLNLKEKGEYAIKL